MKPRDRKSIYAKLIKIEINLLKPRIREMLPNDEIFYDMMFEIRSLQTRIVDRLISAQNHLP